MHTRLFLKRCFSLALFPLALAALGPAQARKAASQQFINPPITILHSLSLPNGRFAQNLTVGADGALYGVAAYGGAVNGGTIFKFTQEGLFHTLADLYPQNGQNPMGPLLLMPDGSLMGTAFSGGKSGTGALFLFTPPHRFQTKHEFAACGEHFQNTRGAFPQGPLALGPDGAVYGATRSGGAGGSGVVYRWTAARGVEVVHDFLDGAQGAGPVGLTLGPDGALYGATAYGGTSSYGTVFRLTTGGMFTMLHAFRHADGVYPSQPPVFGPDGALYGITSVGDPTVLNAQATAYRLALDDKFSVVHTFIRSEEGADFGPLTLGPDGDFYSTAESAGHSGFGTVFRLSPSGKFTLLYAFQYRSLQGANPIGGVTFEPNGRLFGTTAGYGEHNDGTVYKLRLPE